LHLNFTWPSTAQYSGGVAMLYEFANALSGRGHEVHFIHGPAWPDRITHPDQITWFDFHHGVVHHVVDSLDDESIPPGDVFFSPSGPARLGHSAVILQGYGMLPEPLERETFRFRGLKICVAQWLVDIGIEYGSPREQLVHVPYGMDHDLFRVITPPDERPVDVAVLYVKHPTKGWGVASEALALVRERRPDLRVEVFGVLPPATPIPTWMHFQRGLDREHLVSGIYNQAKVFLQASWREGFGLTAVEAMASGCALVTTDNGGSRDYALPGETAIVAPPGDAAGLAAGITSLLDDDDRRIAMARSGAAYTRRFTWARAAESAEAHLLRYVADPARFQVPPGPNLRTGDAEVVDPTEALAVLEAEFDTPTVPDEADFVFNIVWTGVVFSYLQFFVASQIAQSRSRFRFVANGCDPSEVALMERFRAAHPDRVVEVLVVSEHDMVPHGTALDRVREQRHDGDWFCLMDPDIKANAPFAADFAELMATHDVVTSGKEVWTEDNLVPEGNFGVAGEHFYGRDGFVFGSPHLAIYRRRLLDETCDRWGIGLGSKGPDMRPDAAARMIEFGCTYTAFDTAKVVNVLLQADGRRLLHRDLPQLVHIGGLAHYISPPGYRTDGGDAEEPDWTIYPEMASRHEVTRYTARLLEALAEGRPTPPVPQGLEPDLEARLQLVQREVVDLIDRYGQPTPPTAPAGRSST
jgi:glycosyltransferase involved in cell wall biosynthesis